MELLKIAYYLVEYYQTLIIISIISLLIYWMRNVKNLPPGPWGLPIVGCLPFIRGPQHIAITKLGEKYGHVMSMYLGSVLVIVLGDYNAIKEAFVKQGFLYSGKPATNPLKIFDDDAGLGVMEGEVASEHRRFILSSFRDLGMGKSTLEPHIMNEIKYFLNEVKKTHGQPIDLGNLIAISVANIIALLEFGDRLEYENPILHELTTAVFTGTKNIGSVAFRVFFPWTKVIPFFESITGLNQLKKAVLSIENILSDVIKNEEKNYVDGSKTHYIDSYITKRRHLIKEAGSEGSFTMQVLRANGRNLYGAGVETTTTFILWAVVYMLNHPEVREKVQNEIDEVIGKGRDPLMTDKSNMPYTEATILEIHRISSIVPFSLVHSNMEETNLFGYRIPKRSYVIGNLWAVHHDKTLWNDPEKFKPERFIDEYGKIHKPDYLIPFSIGKRNCIGERLASTTSFLYFVSLFQQFNIQLPVDETVSFQAQVGVTLHPKPYNVCAIPY